MTEWERAFIVGHRVARLGTVDAAGRPHVVPVVYAFEDAHLYIPVDAKPKRVGARRLQRIRNLLLNPQVSLVIDDYSEDWGSLAWVQIRGRAEVVEEGPLLAAGVETLRRKYRQYETLLISLVVVVTPTRVLSWRAAGNG